MKKTRFKIVVFFGLILSFLCVYSIFKGMDGVAIILSGGVAGIVAKYTNDETKRPSKTNDLP